MIHMEPKLVKRSIEMSLKKLQLSYLDLYLVHFPVPLVVNIQIITFHNVFIAESISGT